MRVQNSINNSFNINYQRDIYQPHFAANKRLVVNKAGKFLYKNYSCYFRDDLDWKELAKFIIRKYKKVMHPKIVCLACSEGAEPFTLAMMLDKLKGKKASKFFPVQASDFDEQILDNPKHGKVFLSNGDIYEINNHVPDFKKYITLDGKRHLNHTLAVEGTNGKVTNLLLNAVDFHKGDLRSEISNIKPNNDIVLCRNVWPYIPRDEHEELAKMLYNHMGENSMLVIGAYEYKASFFNEELIKVGFQPLLGFSERYSDQPLVFIKPASKKPNKLSISSAFKTIKTFISSMIS